MLHANYKISSTHGTKLFRTLIMLTMNLVTNYLVAIFQYGLKKVFPPNRSGTGGNLFFVESWKSWSPLPPVGCYACTPFTSGKFQGRLGFSTNWQVCDKIICENVKNNYARLNKQTSFYTFSVADSQAEARLTRSVYSVEEAVGTITYTVEFFDSNGNQVNAEEDFMGK